LIGIHLDNQQEWVCEEKEVEFLTPVVFFLQNYQKNQIKEEKRDKLRSEKNNSSPQTAPMFHHALGMADLASYLVSGAVVGYFRPLT
jgi:hypothetical protein